MKRAAVARIIPVLLAFSIVGCSHSSSNSDDSVKPTLVAFHAASDMSDATFLRVEEVWASIAYGVGTTVRSVDADQYDLHFDSLLPGDETTSCGGDLDKDGVKDTNECTRVATKSVNLINGHEYVAALLGAYGSLGVTVYDDPAHVFSTTSNSGTGDTDMEVQFFNWSNKLGTFDVYIEPPGTNLSTTQVKATLAQGQEFTGLVEQGTYVVTLTPVGDPNNPFYLSQNFDVTERTRVGFAILDGTDQSSNVKVSRFRDQGGDLLDRRVQTFLRMSHVAPNTSNVDVFAQENYTAPLFANIALKQTTPYTLLDPSNLAPLELDVTPAGNVGVLLERSQINMTPGTLSTIFLVNVANGTLNALQSIDTARRIAPYAQLRLANTLTQPLDYYVIAHDNNVFTSTVTAALGASSIGGAQLFAPGDYDVVVMRSGTSTVVFGPQVVHMVGSGLYTIVGVPTADISRADILQLGDFLN